MKISKLIVSIAAILLLTACATPYQPFELFGRGGYTEKKLSDDTYRVTFYGNHTTSMETINSLLLYRTSVLTVENGYDYFEVLSGEARMPGSFYGGFRQADHTVKMHKGDPEKTSDRIYVARKIIENIAPQIDKQK